MGGYRGGVPIEAGLAATVVTSRAAMPGVVPHGGGAIVILVVSLAAAVITAIVAIEGQRDTRTVLRWMIAALLVTFVVISAVHYVLT